MTEYSLLWATGTSGDGTDAYTSDETRKLWLAMFSNGVFKGYLNGLAVTGTASPIAVNTGAAIIQGHPYFNTASVSKTISTPSTGTTGLRVVVRVDWLGRVASTVTPPLYPATNQYEARIVVITNEDGTAAIPDPITTDADTYDLTLATGTITTAGVIALTDARTYAKARREDIAAADISNRTRSFFVNADVYYGYEWAGTGYTYLHRDNINGRLMSSVDSAFYARTGFLIPADYASNMTVTAIILHKQTDNPGGNIRHEMIVEHGAIGESAWIHTVNVDEATLAIDNTDKLIAACTATLPNAATGDIVTAEWKRDGTDPLDTFNSVVPGYLYFVGFLVTYTADS